MVLLGMKPRGVRVCVCSLTLPTGVPGVPLHGHEVQEPPEEPHLQPQGPEEPGPPQERPVWKHLPPADSHHEGGGGHG